MKINSIDNKEAEIRSENDAFRRIRPVLEKIGWRYVEKHVSYREYNNSLNIVITSALKLENDETIITLIPYKIGIEISKEGIPGPRNFYFRFLNNLLYFLIKNGITEICRPLFSDDEFSTPKDQTDFETGLIKRLKERGFVAQKDSNKARLDVNSFLEQYDQGDIDYSLLSKSFANRISNITNKTVEVFFVFPGNEDKNFTVDYHFEDYDTIRKRVVELIKEMPKDKSSNLILKTLFAPTFEADLKITDEERDLIGQAFQDILERLTASEDYRLKLRQMGYIISGSFHYECGGFENGFNSYLLTLDNKAHSFQIEPFRTT